MLLNKPTATATYRGVANWVSKVIGRRLTFKSIARRVVFTKLANADEITLHDAAKHVGVQPRTLNVYHQKGKQVKSKAAMLLSKHNVAEEEEQSKAEPCPKPELKAEPCPKPPQNPSPMKVKLESPQEMDNRQVSIYTISDDDLLSSHSCDVLNSSMELRQPAGGGGVSAGRPASHPAGHPASHHCFVHACLPHRSIMRSKLVLIVDCT